MTRSKLILSVIFIVVSICGAAEAADDVTGIWTVTAEPKAKVLIERQGGTYRVGLTSAKLLGGRQDWYIGAGLDPQSIRFLTVKEARSSIGTRGKSNIVDSLRGSIQFDDVFRGSLTIRGRTFAIERTPLVPDGLTSPILSDVPETGWYVDGKTGAHAVFMEVQNNRAFIYFFSPDARRQLQVSIARFDRTRPERWRGLGEQAQELELRTSRTSITNFEIQTSMKGRDTQRRHREYNRWRPDSRDLLTEDLTTSLAGEDRDANGVRDDIDALLASSAYRSSRIKDTLREIAGAYRAYLVAEGIQSATEAFDRIETASACAAALIPQSGEADVFLIGSLVFNTPARIAARLRLDEFRLGRVSPALAISRENTNDCATFMQGVVRRYDTISAADAAAARRRPRQVETSSATSANQSLRDSHPGIDVSGTYAAARQRTCSDTQVFYVSGVRTDQFAADKDMAVLIEAMQASELDDGFDYEALADRNPGTVNDIVQYLVQQKNISQREAMDIAQSGLKYIRVGFKVIKNIKTKTGVFFGTIFIGTGVLKNIFGLYAQSAILENAEDVTFLRSRILEQINEGRRVVLVAHSRGNLRSNSVWESLVPAQQSAVRIASVANAASSVASGGRGATRDDDLIMKLTRELFDSERPTIAEAGKPDEGFGHSFIGSYIKNTIAKTFVLDRIRSALDKARRPPTSTPRVIGSTSGGYTGFVAQEDAYDIGQTKITARLDYEAFSIPDQFDVYRRGKRIASTGGLVSGSGTLNVRIPYDPSNPADGKIIVAVYGPNQGTAWNYTLTCPDFD